MTFPRTLAWLDDRLDAKAELALRRLLRQVRHAAGAELAVVWAGDGPSTRVVEFAGDSDLLPASWPFGVRAAPQRFGIRDRRGCDHDAVGVAVRPCRDAPAMALMVVAPRVLEPASLLDLVENAGAAVEEVVVLGRVSTEMRDSLRMGQMPWVDP